MILGLLGILTGIYLRFSNIDMTETRLFLNYWYLWLVTILCFLIGAILLHE